MLWSTGVLCGDQEDRAERGARSNGAEGVRGEGLRGQPRERGGGQNDLGSAGGSGWVKERVSGGGDGALEHLLSSFQVS